MVFTYSKILYIKIPVATATLSDSFLPRIGICQMESMRLRILGEIPLTSLPTITAKGNLGLKPW